MMLTGMPMVAMAMLLEGLGETREGDDDGDGDDEEGLGTTAHKNTRVLFSGSS